MPTFVDSTVKLSVSPSLTAFVIWTSNFDLWGEFSDFGEDVELLSSSEVISGLFSDTWRKNYINCHEGQTEKKVEIDKMNNASIKSFYFDVWKS